MNITDELKIPEGTKKFPRLKELRGKHDVSLMTIASIIGAKNHATPRSRIENGDFTLLEMLRIVAYFNQLGEKETLESIFVSWITQMSIEAAEAHNKSA